MDDSSPHHRGLKRLLAAPAILAAFSVAGCTSYLGTTAASFMKQVRQNPDPNERFIAYQKLASPNCYDTEAQKAQAVKILIGKLEEGREPIATRAVICRTLGDLKNRSARLALIKAVSDNDAIVRVQACRALGKVGKEEDAMILCRVMSMDSLEDCRIAAIEALGDLNSQDSRVLVMLLEGMENDDPAIRLASLNTLKQITRKDAGVEVAAWRKELKTQLEATPTALGPMPAEPTAPEARAYPPKPNVPSVLTQDPKTITAPSLP